MADETNTAPVDTDLLGGPIPPETPALTVEGRLSALEALTAKLLDYGASLQVEETQARLKALEEKTEAPFSGEELEARIYQMEGKLDRIAGASAAMTYPQTIDQLPSPFAPEPQPGG